MAKDVLAREFLFANFVCGFLLSAYSAHLAFTAWAYRMIGDPWGFVPVGDLLNMFGALLL